MKKFLKTLLVGLIAVVMSFAVFAVAACTDTDNGGGQTNTGNEGGNQGGNQGENQGGNQGENQGGNQGENQGGNQGENQGGNQGENQGGNEGGNHGTTVKSLTLGDNNVTVPAGERVTYKVDVSTDIKNLHITTDNSALKFLNRLQQTLDEIDLENSYTAEEIEEGLFLTLTVYNTGDAEVTAKIKIEEAQGGNQGGDEEDDGIPALTLGEAEEFNAGYFGVVYKFEIPADGDYAIDFELDGEYTFEEDLYIPIGTGYSSATAEFTGEIELDDVINLEAGTYYIGIYSNDANVVITGKITIKLAEVSD